MARQISIPKSKQSQILYGHKISRHPPNNPQSPIPIPKSFSVVCQANIGYMAHL
jgi:hypothetical protein